MCVDWSAVSAIFLEQSDYVNQGRNCWVIGGTTSCIFLPYSTIWIFFWGAKGQDPPNSSARVSHTMFMCPRSSDRCLDFPVVTRDQAVFCKGHVFLKQNEPAEAAALRGCPRYKPPSLPEFASSQHSWNSILGRRLKNRRPINFMVNPAISIINIAI